MMENKQMFETNNQIWYDVTLQVKPGQNRAQNSDGDIPL